LLRRPAATARTAGFRLVVGGVQKVRPGSASLDEKCQAHGLPTGVADKVRRYRLLLGAYGIEPDIDFVQIGLERLRQFHAYIRQLVADGSEWQVALAQRGIVDEEALEIAWVEEHAAALAGR
jgi:hypothetical protein